MVIAWVVLIGCQVKVPDITNTSLPAGCPPYCSKVNLSWANLAEVNLSEADLSEANLKCANLRQVTLCGVNLAWADLFKSETPAFDAHRRRLLFLPELRFYIKAKFIMEKITNVWYWRR